MYKKIDPRTRRILAILAATPLILAPGWAAALEREFPINSRLVKIQSVNDPFLTASGKRYHMPPGLLIFNSNNTTIVRNALPTGISARIQLDLNGDLRRIWILTPEELASSARRPAAAGTLP